MQKKEKQEECSLLLQSVVVSTAPKSQSKRREEVAVNATNGFPPEQFRSATKYETSEGTRLSSWSHTRKRHGKRLTILASIRAISRFSSLMILILYPVPRLVHPSSRQRGLVERWPECRSLKGSHELGALHHDRSIIDRGLKTRCHHPAKEVTHLSEHRH